MHFQACWKLLWVSANLENISCFALCIKWHNFSQSSIVDVRITSIVDVRIKTKITIKIFNVARGKTAVVHGMDTKGGKLQIDIDTSTGFGISEWIKLSGFRLWQETSEDYVIVETCSQLIPNFDRSFELQVYKWG